VFVTVDSVHVVGSPFGLTISPGEAFAGNSEVSGNGLFSALVGKRASVIITMKDWYRNVRVSSYASVAAREAEGLGDDQMVVFQPFNKTFDLFQFDSIGAGGAKIEVVKTGDQGNFVASWQPSVAGDLQFHLLICDRLCCTPPGCPELAACKAAQNCDELECVVDGEPYVPCQPATAANKLRSPFQLSVQAGYGQTLARSSTARGDGLPLTPKP
jgi:hypothetical protein